MRLIIEGMAVQPSSKKIKHSRKRHYSNWKYCPLYPPVHLFSGILNIFEFSLNSNCYTSITINADFLSEGFHFKTVLWKELIPRQYVRKERWSLIFNHLEIYRKKAGYKMSWLGTLLEWFGSARTAFFQDYLQKIQHSCVTTTPHCSRRAFFLPTSLFLL